MGGLFLVDNDNPHPLLGKLDSTKTSDPTPSIQRRPEVIDDFIRNFFSSKGLVRSLDTFQVRA